MGYNFSSLFKDNPIQEELRKEVAGGVFSSIEYTVKSIVNRINTIDQCTDEEIKDIIIRNHKIIFNYDLFLRNDESRKAAQQLFTNKRFLGLFLDVSGLLQLTREEIICINKVVYDYYFKVSYDTYFDRIVVDADISRLLMQISYNINNQLIIKLYPKLGVESSRHLAMVANSSFKEDKVVHRVNFFLMRYQCELSLQDIVDIFCYIFPRFSNLFIHTMLEIKQPGMNNNELKRFDQISQAMIVILHNLTSIEMKKVLYNYGYYLLLNNNYMVRFSLKTIQNERIQKIINEVEYGEMEILKIP